MGRRKGKTNRQKALEEKQRLSGKVDVSPVPKTPPVSEVLSKSAIPEAEARRLKGEGDQPEVFRDAVTGEITGFRSTGGNVALGQNLPKDELRDFAERTKALEADRLQNH